VKSNSKAQSRNSLSIAKCSFLRSAALVVTAGLLLGGCDKRHDAQVTPTPSTPRPKASAPAIIVQKPQAELAKMFSAATPVVSSAKTPEEFAKIKPGGDTILSPQPNGLKIIGTGRRPTVLLPGFRSGRAILEFVIHTPVDTTLQVLYRLPGQKKFTNAQSFKQRMTAGKNVIYAELPALVPNGALRFHPGAVAGEYLLESFEAKAVPSDGTR
jgi:hypothetical protein